MPPKRKKEVVAAVVASSSVDLTSTPPKRSKRGDQVKKDYKVDDDDDDEEKDMAVGEVDDSAGKSVEKKIIEELKKNSKIKKDHKVDDCCDLHAASVVDDYDCMLNQTNIGQNNNKFYVIQVLRSASKFHVWTRWGRVGEPGMNKLLGPFATQDKAVADFKKKFKDKTRNNWEDRENFVKSPGKYDLIEMDDDDDGGDDDESGSADKGNRPENLESQKSCLDLVTQDLMKMIFDDDMFRDAMKELEIDVKKMPLGKISKSQIAKGFEVLEEIGSVIDSGERKKNLEELSSRFYTAIPHNFGRMTPPVISDLETLQKKKDMLTVLGDIEIAQSLQKDQKIKNETEVKDLPEHPLDVKYKTLDCHLNVLEKKSDMGKTIMNYFTASARGKVQNIWEVDRSTEGSRFSVNDSLENRKLLWHGTNIAVVAAILKSGLRIMPHSGGRVGKGIYLASEASKSQGYASTNQARVGIMFLNEVALGKEHQITMDDHTLTSPPKGYDSVVAKGYYEPDSSEDVTKVIGGHDVVVPVGCPRKRTGFTSSFSQSEYLVYREDQCRIRYMLTFKF